MPRFPPLLLLLAALLAVAAGCGGDDGDGSASATEAEQVLKQTFTGTKRMDSGRFSVRLNVDGSQPTAIVLRGAFQTRGTGRTPKFDVNADVGAQRLGAVSTGDRGFVRRDGQAYAVPPALFEQFAGALAQATGKPGAATRATLGLDPRSWLQDPRIAGDATVGDVRTTRITANLDGTRFLGGLRALLERVRSLGVGGATGPLPEARAVRGGRVELDSGKADRLLRRLAVRLQAADGASMRLEYAITGLDEPQAIAAPRAAKPLSELLPGLP